MRMNQLVLKKMEEFCELNNYIRLSKCHREIYLSDPSRIDPGKMKTILRFKVARK
jgi:arabinogalactan oligomer/maltooligosaccharide transport system substrate-binding protein